MITTTRQLRHLLNPWPMAYTLGKYEWTVSTVAKCRRLKCIWRTGDGRQISMTTAAKVLRSYWPDHYHHVTTLEMNGPGLPWIIVEDGIVVDGNHRFIAMIRNKYRGPIIRIDYIKGSGKGDENIPKLRKFWKAKRKGAWA